jgi:putative acetyltransferase
MISVRPVEVKDVSAVVELVRVTLAEFGIVFGEGAPTDTQLAELPQSYTATGGAFFVALEDEALIGTAGVALIAPSIFELRKMYLRPAARGQGVGQRLFDACLAHVTAHGGRQLVLDTTEKMTSAIAFYERNGFVRDDAQRRASRCSRGYRREL